jgi:hypothetical protein
MRIRIQLITLNRIQIRIQHHFDSDPDPTFQFDAVRIHNTADKIGTTATCAPLVRRFVTLLFLSENPY